jgi:hypothetical protein
MNDDVAALLLSVIAEVDQMGAELNDPETPPGNCRCYTVG